MGFARLIAVVSILAAGATDARAEATLPAPYQEKCAACHGPLSTFAHRDLVSIGGVLTGKVSGKPVGMFLSGHGRLRPSEIPGIVAALADALAAPPR